MDDSYRKVGGLVPGSTIYYWQYGFMHAVPTFMLDRSHNPYRRLSVTLLFAMREAFTLEIGKGKPEVLVSRAVMLAPKVYRRKILAADSDLVILDFAITTAQYNALATLLNDRDVHELDESLLAILAPCFQKARRGELSDSELKTMVNALILRMTGQVPVARKTSPRITHALQLIQERSMQAVSLDWLAEQVHMSTSRFRHLFRTEVGSNLTHFLRWNAVWKSIWLWKPGISLSELADTGGFYDLAHFNRAFNEAFGQNPSAASNAEKIRLIRCDLT